MYSRAHAERIIDAYDMAASLSLLASLWCLSLRVCQLFNRSRTSSRKLGPFTAKSCPAGAHPHSQRCINRLQHGHRDGGKHKQCARK